MAADDDLVICFRLSKLDALIPEEGDYRAAVRSVHHRSSAAGNSTIQVIYDLLGVEPGWDRVSEYFVRSGNPQAVAISQNRLLALCRACGMEPREGEEIYLRDLVGQHLELRVGHETYEGRKRLSVLW